MTTCLMLQTKDKMCDIIDTTYLYPLTTTIVATTTSRSREVTAGRDTAPTSHPPTSIPTEGKEESLQHRAFTQVLLARTDVYLRVCSFEGEVSAILKKHKYKL